MLKVQTIKVLDPLAVQAEGNAASAVATISIPERISERRCDVVVLGGGMGGSAAALKAAEDGMHVCMTEPTNWVGGQMTSQGISAFDDNELTETTGSSRSFQQLRHLIRQHYAPMLREGVKADKTFNPGLCWVSYECSEATVDHDVLRSMLEPYIRDGRLTLLLRTVPVLADTSQGKIKSVVVYGFQTHQLLRLLGSIFIDATELGEFLPLSGAQYVTGAESQKETGEADAPLQADPDAAQSFTYAFVLEQGSSSSATAKPAGYDGYLSHFSLNSTDAEANTLSYGVFKQMPNTPGSFWSYRRLVAKEQFKPGAFSSDLSMINWDSNDVCDNDLLSLDPLKQAKAMQHGKQVSLAFAWWLQHEVPRDDGQGRGYPDLKIVPSAMDSSDGLSQFPYIRESRRIKALRIIREQDLVTKDARAVRFDDSVGIGQYPIDIHSCDKVPHLPASKPYQIPFGAMLPVNIDNLMAASKNLGTTHITNGAYRLHPTEWALGSAAGAAAALAIKNKITLKQIDSDAFQLRSLQRELISSGQPLVWFDDVQLDSPYFQNVQLASILGLVELRKDSLSFKPGDPVTGKEIAFSLRQLEGKLAPRVTSGLAKLSSAKHVQWAELGQLGLVVDGKNGEITRGEFVNWLMSSYQEKNRSGI